MSYLVKYSVSNPDNCARGFTLIELMISLTIGTILTFTGLTLYTQMSKSSSIIRTESALQENVYFVQQSVRQYINQAGYRPLLNSPPAAPLLPITDPTEAFPEVAGKWQAGQYIRAVTDGIAIRFEGASDADGNADGSLINCQREAIAESAVVELAFTVDDGSLICTSDSEDIEFIGEDDGFTIEETAFTFGIDTNNDGSVDVYRDASSALADTENLVSVRISLLLSSVNEVRSYNADYTFNDVSYTSSDNKIRQESIILVELKN